MSDIHGQYDAFIKMLKRIKFKDSDKLYVIGDVIDRGPNSIKTLLYIMEKENINMLAGNHEYMATLCLSYLIREISNDIVDKLSNNTILELFEQWFMNGGKTTLEELISVNLETRNRVLNYLVRLKLYKEVEVGEKKFILVHAGLGNFKKSKKLKDYSIMELVWDRMDYNKKYFDDKYLVVGHTPTQLIKNNKNPGYIYFNNNNIVIDCGCIYKGGRLGCLRLEEMREYYI